MKWLWFHWQNLNDKPAGRQGWGIRHGRCWLHLGPLTLEWCWLLWGNFCRALVELGPDSENTFSMSLGVPPVSLWFNLEWPWLVRKRWWQWLFRARQYEAREWGITFHGWMLWLRCGQTIHTWDQDDPWWWEMTINIPDLILGRTRHTERELSTRSVEIPMPEGSYDGVVTVREGTWKRPRWPFSRRIVTATVDIEDGIPFPGKGTCAYNCGEDRLMGTSVVGSSVSKAIGNVVATVLDYRERYPL